MSRRMVALLIAVGALGACASAGGTPNAASSATRSSSPAGPLTTAVSTTTIAPTTTAAPTTTTAPSAPQRIVHEQPWIAFGMAGDVTLHYTSSRVERIGFHQSNHEGAQDITPFDTGIPATTMESRDRLSGLNSAADVVVDPESEIRAPVTGTVLRAEKYVLYCDTMDEYTAIEPDDHPGWEVKVLHIVNLQVQPGDRVVAGETVIAEHAHQLPFASQVDDLRTVDPAWPHTHIEVVDPSIPNVPNPGSGSENC